MVVKSIIGIAIGGLLGLLYYKYIGCSTGSCPITGNPYVSSIYGSVMGFLLSAAI